MVEGSMKGIMSQAVHLQYAVSTRYCEITRCIFSVSECPGCQTCDVNPCMHGGQCNRVIGKAVCTCPPCYTGQHCERGKAACVVQETDQCEWPGPYVFVHAAALAVCTVQLRSGVETMSACATCKVSVNDKSLHTCSLHGPSTSHRALFLLLCVHWSKTNVCALSFASGTSAMGYTDWTIAVFK